MTTPFARQIGIDNQMAFLNRWEFAQTHNLNGTECRAIVQDVTVEQSLSTGDETYYTLYGSRLMVNCLKSDLEEVPVYGQIWTLDGKQYLVDSVADDMGILTIQLEANDR